MTEQTIYQWPHYYDWTSEGLEHDTSFYVELAKQSGGPVLELGCGTGRISLAIAREGIKVVGLDRELKMLEQAQRKAKAMGLSSMIDWENQDIAHFQLQQKFPLIIIPYRSFQHLCTVSEQTSALHTIHEHLMDTGMLACNIFVPEISKITAMDGLYSYRGTFPVPGSEEKVDVYDMVETDHFNQILQVVRYYERFSQIGISLERLRTQMKIRYIYPGEFTHLLSHTGFRIQARYGDFLQGSFHSHSQELIIVAGKY